MRQTKPIRRIAAGIMAAMLMLLATPALALEGIVNTGALVLRKSANRDSKPLQTLGKGDKVNIRGSEGEWYRVTYGKYAGYVMKQYVQVKEEESPQGAPAVSRPGDRGSHVKQLQKALKAAGFYTGSIDGIYGSGTTAAVKAFQRRHGLTRDGIAGKVTIRLLFGQEAAGEELKTEKLTWFGHENTIPKGAKVVIKDCLTGKTFNAVRWSGVNHMDTEPATREDTAVMKEICGGSWSWRRRPILVKYNGHVYAASMNGMPHGTSTRDNGFDGHFCIHFTFSRTHESNRVDEDHQNAAEKALGYTW